MISPEVLQNSGTVGLVGATVVGAFVLFAPQPGERHPSSGDQFAGVTQPATGAEPSRGGRTALKSRRSDDDRPDWVRRARPPASSGPESRGLEARNRAAERALHELDGVVAEPKPSDSPGASLVATRVKEKTLQTVLEITLRTRKKTSVGCQNCPSVAE